MLGLALARAKMEPQNPQRAKPQQTEHCLQNIASLQRKKRTSALPTQSPLVRNLLWELARWSAFRQAQRPTEAFFQSDTSQN